MTWQLNFVEPLGTFSLKLGFTSKRFVRYCLWFVRVRGNSAVVPACRLAVSVPAPCDDPVTYRTEKANVYNGTSFLFAPSNTCRTLHNSFQVLGVSFAYTKLNLLFSSRRVVCIAPGGSFIMRKKNPFSFSLRSEERHLLISNCV